MVKLTLSLKDAVKLIKNSLILCGICLSFAMYNEAFGVGYSYVTINGVLVQVEQPTVSVEQELQNLRAVVKQSREKDSVLEEKIEKNLDATEKTTRTTAVCEAGKVANESTQEIYVIANKICVALGKDYVAGEKLHAIEEEIDVAVKEKLSAIGKEARIAAGEKLYAAAEKFCVAAVEKSDAIEEEVRIVEKPDAIEEKIRIIIEQAEKETRTAIGRFRMAAKEAHEATEEAHEATEKVRVAERESVAEREKASEAEEVRVAAEKKLATAIGKLFLAKEKTREAAEKMAQTEEEVHVLEAKEELRSAASKAEEEELRSAASKAEEEARVAMIEEARVVEKEKARIAMIKEEAEVRIAMIKEKERARIAMIKEKEKEKARIAMIKEKEKEKARIAEAREVEAIEKARIAEARAVEVIEKAMLVLAELQVEEEQIAETEQQAVLAKPWVVEAVKLNREMAIARQKTEQQAILTRYDHFKTWVLETLKKTKQKAEFNHLTTWAGKVIEKFAQDTMEKLKRKEAESERQRQIAESNRKAAESERQRQRQIAESKRQTAESKRQAAELEQQQIAMIKEKERAQIAMIKEKERAQIAESNRKTAESNRKTAELEQQTAESKRQTAKWIAKTKRRTVARKRPIEDRSERAVPEDGVIRLLYLEEIYVQSQLNNKMREMHEKEEAERIIRLRMEEEDDDDELKKKAEAIHLATIRLVKEKARLAKEKTPLVLARINQNVDRKKRRVH